METKKFLDGEGLKTLWSEITSLQSDYNETDETSPNYIKNKPFTIDVIPEEVIEEFTFTTSDTIDESTGLPTMQYVQMFDDLTIGQKMNLQFTYPELAAATGLPQYDDNGEVIFKTVRYEDVEIGNFADAMGSEFLDSPAIMMGPGAMIETLPESIQRVAIPNDDIVFVYSNATLANGTKTPLLITALMDWSAENYSTYVATCHTSTFATEEINLVATRESHIALQSDWDEQNKENSAYIQNKPFGSEIVLTPKNEFYRDGFKEWYGDESSGFGNPGYNLQTEVGKQYIVQFFGIDGEAGQITLTCVESIQGLNIPEGAHFLGDLDSNGQLQSLTFLIDNAKRNDSEEIVYDESSCMIPFTTDIYKIVILDTPLEGTYERTVINKIDKKYLPKADQSYDWTSENAQSGIAVNEAVSKIQNKLPSSVVTDLTTPTTLGDQHIKVQLNNTNSNTFPNSTAWDVYTTGIGLNSDLKTDAKDTIIDAINENVVNLNKLKIQPNIKLDSIIDNNTLINYDIATQSNNFIYLSDEEIEDDKIASQLYVRNLLNATPNNIIISPTEDGFIWYDKKEYKVYRLTSNGILSLNKDYSNEEEYKKISDNFFADAHYYKGYYINTPTKGNKHYNDFYIIKATGEALEIKIDDNNRRITLTSYNPYNSERPLLGTFSVDYKDALKGTCYNLMISKTTNHQSYPGKFNFILHTEKGSIGEDNWSNIQSLGTFTRVLNEEGIEQVMIRVSGKSWSEPNIFTNIDNNKHSGYCNVDNNTIACLSSSKEILFRDKTNGSIVKKVSLETCNDSDLFNEIQFYATYFYNNCLYIVAKEAIYKISNLETNETPIINRINLYQDAYTRKPGDIKLINNCLMFYDYSQINLSLLESYSQHFLTGLPLKKILPKTPIKSDYNQNDSTQLDYIKNKPIIAKYVNNYFTKDTVIACATTLDNSAFTLKDKFMDLKIGQKYKVDITVKSTVDNTSITHTFDEVDCINMQSFWTLDEECPSIVIAPQLLLTLFPNIPSATLSDGLIFMCMNNTNSMTYDTTKCIVCAGEIDQVGVATQNIEFSISVYQTDLESHIETPYAKALQADWLETDETKIGYIKNKTGASEYYSFNLKDFVDIEFGSTTLNHTVSSPSSNAYYDTLTIAGFIGLGGMDNGKYVNITNIPYEVLYINDAPYLKNRQSFKNIGISSPSLKQFFNYDGIVWFDTIETLHKNWLKDGEFISLWNVDNDSYSIIAGFSIMGQVKRGSAVQEHSYSQQIRALWEAVFNDPETKIVIEYQDPKNIPHKEGQLILPLSTVEEEE